MQWGDVVWSLSNTGENFLRDEFNIRQIGFKIESDWLRFVRPELFLGYQKASEIELVDVNTDQFEGVFVGFTVKVGYFNQ